MKVFPIAFLFLTSLSPLMGASLSERIALLERQVSDLQRQIKDLKSGASYDRESGQSGSYTVRSGDSYWTIARDFKVSVSALEQANPSIDARRLAVGRTIKLPSGSQSRPAATPPAPRRTGMGTYRIKSGDILGRISESHGIRLHQLMSANPGLDPRRLRVGKVINIPGQGSSPAPAQSSQTHHECQPQPEPQPRYQAQPAPPRRSWRQEAVRATQDTVPVSQGVHARRNPYLSNASNADQSYSRNYYDAKPPEPRLVPVSRTSRLSEIAQLHGTTVARINQLNDVDLGPEQMIRSGSQLYVPGR